MTGRDRPVCDCPEPCACYARGQGRGLTNCRCSQWTLRNSSGVSKGIDKPVIQSGRDFPYIRVGGGQ